MHNNKKNYSDSLYISVYISEQKIIIKVTKVLNKIVKYKYFTINCLKFQGIQMTSLLNWYLICPH